MSERKHVFIVGAKRSGTTWTTSLLTQHPDIACFFHSDLFRRMRDLVGWLSEAHPSKEILLPAQTDGGASPEKPFEKVPIREMLSEEELIRYCREYSDHIIDKVMAARPGAKVFLESTPEHLECLDFLLVAFPDAYILHVVRDPRSVYASWRSAASTWASPKIFATDPAAFAHRWKSDIQMATHAQALTPHYLAVNYESLLDNGPEELLNIFSWMGLEADETLCRKAIESCEIGKMKQSTVFKAGNFIRKGKAQGWRDELSGSVVRAIEYIDGDLMEDLGYPRQFSRGSNKPFRIRIYEILTRLRNLGDRLARLTMKMHKVSLRFLHPS